MNMGVINGEWHDEGEKVPTHQIAQDGESLSPHMLGIVLSCIIVALLLAVGLLAGGGL